MRRLTSAILPRDGRADFLRSFYTRFHSGGTPSCSGQPGQLYPVTAVSCLSFIHLHMLRSWRVYFLHRPRPETCAGNGRPITRRPFHTHLCFGKNYFCTGQTQGLYPESAVPNCPFISHMLLIRPFHTFLPWEKFFLYRASPSTLPGGCRSHVFHSFYTCFSSGGARFCTGRARRLYPVTAILPLIHSFLHVFVLAKTFSRQSNP